MTLTAKLGIFIFTVGLVFRMYSLGTCQEWTLVSGLSIGMELALVFYS